MRRSPPSTALLSILVVVVALMRDMTLFLFSFSVPSSHSGYAIYLLVTRIMYSFTVPVENAVFKSVLALIVESYLEVQKKYRKSHTIYVLSTRGRTRMRLFYVHTGSFSVLPGNAIYLRPSQNSYNRQGFVFKVANTTPLVCPIAALLFLAVVSRVFF